MVSGAGRITIRKNESIGIIRKILLFLILFGFIFEFPMMGFVTSRRLSLFMAVMYLIANKKTLCVIKKCKLQYTVLVVLCLFACMSIAVINGIGLQKVKGFDYFESRYILYCICYIMIMPVFVAVAFKDIYEFCRLYISIILFQSVIVYISAVNAAFRMFLYQHFYFGDSRFETTVRNGSRIIGMNLHGSLGSIILFSGTVLLVYLALKKKISNLKFSLCYFVIFGATFFIARTGMYLELLLFVYYIFITENTRKKYLNIMAVIGLSVCGLGFVFSRMDKEIAGVLFRWAGELFNPETRFKTINILAAMKIPALSSETIFGTNIMRGITPMGITVSNDSGYVQMYAALGLVGAVIYYLSFVVLFLMPLMRKGGRRETLFLLFLTGILFLIEMKEPYIQKYIYAFVLYVLLINKMREESA